MNQELNLTTIIKLAKRGFTLYEVRGGSNVMFFFKTPEGLMSVLFTSFHEMLVSLNQTWIGKGEKLK